MALNSTAADVVLCLSEHISCTINWEPLSDMLVTDARRHQVKHLFKRTIKDDQYTVKAAFNREETPALLLLLEYSALFQEDMQARLELHLPLTSLMENQAVHSEVRKILKYLKSVVSVKVTNYSM